MGEIVEFKRLLPPESEPATRIVHRLAGAGFRALLAGGCVRDLLLGGVPSDYDVATDARPEDVRRLFRGTRHVGAQFGVVLVKQSRKWVEVATFRSDGCYRDGRRPETVTYSDARADAFRRDFTVNGMFLDPIAGEIIDYVAGRNDLAGRVIRAIGEPAERFAEDHLRLLRAVRFAARLDFAIEPRTADAIRQAASQLARVAPERVRDELEKMLGHSGRARAVRLLSELELLGNLWRQTRWTESRVQAATDLLTRFEENAEFEESFAVLVLDASPAEIERICRRLAFSNEQREAVLWIVAHHRDLDDPAESVVPLAALKRLLAVRWFGALHRLIAARYRGWEDGAERGRLLEQRIGEIPLAEIAPAPLVRGDDLLARRVPPGPLFKDVLDMLYTRQLNAELQSREEALGELDRLLAERAGQDLSAGGMKPGESGR